MKNDYTLLEWTDDDGVRREMRMYHDWNMEAIKANVERKKNYLTTDNALPFSEHEPYVDNPLYIKGYRNR